MPSGRANDRERRRRRSDGATARRPERVRRGKDATSVSRKKPRAGSGGQSSARPRPAPRPVTGGAFQLSSTRRASVLALLACVIVLSVSVPFRNYLGQGGELADKQAQQAQLEREVRELEHRKEVLSDPARVEAEARERLGYVRPGETPYIVQVPQPPAPPPVAPRPEPESEAWYSRLWKSMTE